MQHYDLYGITVETIEQAKAVVEEAISVKLETRESAYHRGHYFASGETGEENFEVKANIDPFEDSPLEPEFAKHPFLLYVNNTDRSNALSALLLRANAQVALLRRESFE